MIPILYAENETNFNHNGLGALYGTIECLVTEERNGAFELELVYPVNGALAKEITGFRFIMAKPNDVDAPHLFRIYEIGKNLEEGNITVYAATKTNDLGANLLEHVVVENVTAWGAMDAIRDNLIEPTNYMFISDIQTLNSGEWSNQNPLSAIAGEDGSVLSKWGGEIKRTNDAIYLYGRRGTDKVTVIRPGKNILGFNMVVSTKGMTTGLIPIATYTPRDTNIPYTIRGTQINSPLASNYPVHYLAMKDYSSYDIWPEEQQDGEGNPIPMSDAEFRAAALVNLNNAAASYFSVQNPGSDKPKITSTIDLLLLSDSDEYAKYKNLEHISLTDTVEVYVEQFGVDVEIKVHKLVYDSLKEQVRKIEAGSARYTMYSDVQKTYQDQVDKVKEYISTVENGIYNTIALTADEQNRIFRGYTTPDPSLVKEEDLWFKPVANGEVEMYRYTNGTWALAVTNADKIAIGTLDASAVNVVNINADNIATGSITGPNGEWDLDTGALYLGSSYANAAFKWDGATLTIKSESIVSPDGKTIDEKIDDQVASAPIYTWIKYADNANGSGMSDSSTGKTYLGLASGKTTQVESSNPLDYTWTLIKGPDGIDGINGTDGLPGPKGEDGVSTYTHIAYADSASGSLNFSLVDSNRMFIGILVDNVEADSTDPTKYRWTLVKGADGTNGLPGDPGEDGLTPYFHVAYATNITGTTGFSTTDSVGKTHIGQYTDYVQADSTNPAVYSWTLIKGADGKGISAVTERYLATSASSGVLRETPGWTTTIQTMTSVNKYLWNYETITYTDSSTSTTNPVIIGVYGTDGTNGTNGTNGTDGRSLVGITEYYLASASSSGVTRATSGWTTTVQTTSTTLRYLWNYERLDWNIAPTPTYVEPVIIGVHGLTGQGLVSVSEQYYRSTSNTTQTGGSWLDTAPAYLANTYVWTRLKYIWENPTATTYSTPALSATWGEIHNIVTRVSSAESKLTDAAITDAVERRILVDGTTTIADKSLVSQTADSLSVSFSSSVAGKMLYLDPTFKKGNNGVNVYNNTPDGSVVLSRIAKSSDAPSTSTHMLRIVTTGSTSTPGTGGFHFGTGARANAVLITKIVAKIPVGKTLMWASNATGTGSVEKFITPTAGTGKYETYIHRLVCGPTGTFSSTAFFYLLPTGPVTWDVAFATVYDATNPEEEMITGITTINANGVNVGISTSNVNTQMSYDGLRVYDGSSDLAYFGESGSFVPDLQVNKIRGDVMNLFGPSRTYEVGPTKAYDTISQVFEEIGDQKDLNGATIKINVTGTISDVCGISGFRDGVIELNFNAGAKLSGRITFKYLTCHLYVHGQGMLTSAGTIQLADGTYCLDFTNCAFVTVYYMNLNGGGISDARGMIFRDGVTAYVYNNDIAAITRGLMVYPGSQVYATSNKGDCATNAFDIVSACLYVAGTIPTGSISNNGFYYTRGTITPTSSAVAPPPTTPTVFTSTFKKIKMETYSRTAGYISTYYGSTAAQGKYTGMEGWMEGRITFGTNVAQYWQGGSSISVQMRLHRKDSTHGPSAAVLPDADNFTASWSTGAVRGGWSGWATVSTAEFSTSASKEFRFYSSVLDSGYAIWDDAEVKVTVTRNV